MKSYPNPVRLVPYLVSSALNHRTATLLVVRLQLILFPNGYPGPSPPDPTTDEQMEMRDRLERLLEAKIPRAFLSLPLVNLYPVLVSVSSLTIRLTSQIDGLLQQYQSASFSLAILLLLTHRPRPI